MLIVLINILIICVVGAICFWAIEKFVRDGRLANRLKILVVLICIRRNTAATTSCVGCWPVLMRSFSPLLGPNSHQVRNRAHNAVCPTGGRPHANIAADIYCSGPIPTSACETADSISCAIAARPAQTAANLFHLACRSMNAESAPAVEARTEAATNQRAAASSQKTPIMISRRSMRNISARGIVLEMS